jgi:anti-sigma factor RsiW
MNCEQIAVLIPDYLQSATTTEQTSVVRQHLEECPACHADVELWQKLAILPAEQPGAQLRMRFDAMLESYQQGRWEKDNLVRQHAKFLDFGAIFAWARTPALSVAWAAILVLCAFLGGRYLANDNGSREQLAQLRQELKKTQQLVVVSMLQQQSASERLQGVSYSMRQPDAEPPVLDALLHTLRYDSSVDVRLAALDVLSRYGRRQDVRQGLVDALGTQQSPLVQVALIDVLVEMRNQNAVEELKKLQENPHLDPSVRKRVDWGIQQLS